VSGVPAGGYTGVSSLVGVDAQKTGLTDPFSFIGKFDALSPANNMSWTWSSGHLFLKLEGTVARPLTCQVGGYAAPYNGIVTAAPSFGNNKRHLQADLLRMCDGVTHVPLRTFLGTYMPSPESVVMTQNYAAGMFSVQQVVANQPAHVAAYHLALPRPAEESRLYFPGWPYLCPVEGHSVKAFFSYLLISLVLLQTFSREVLVVDFTLNRATITARFCVNKARPQLHCDGKCYFAKQLKKQEERENKSAGPLKERLEMLPAAFNCWQAAPTRPAYRPAPSYAVLVPGRYAAPLAAVFRPPLG